MPQEIYSKDLGVMGEGLEHEYEKTVTYLKL